MKAALEGRGLYPFLWSTIKLRSQIGTDGMLHLDIPADFKDMEVDVTVTVEPVTKPDESLPEDLSHLEWQKFIAATAGSIDDETFIRQPQGELPDREPLE